MTPKPRAQAGSTEVGCCALFQFQDSKQMPLTEALIVQAASAGSTHVAVCAADLPEIRQQVEDIAGAADGMGYLDLPAPLFKPSTLDTALPGLLSAAGVRLAEPLLAELPLAAAALAAAVSHWRLLALARDTAQVWMSGVQGNCIEGIVPAGVSEGGVSEGGQAELVFQFEVVRGTLAGRVRLDTAAIRALNLLPAQAGDASELSVLGLLAHGCVTAAGKRVLRRWLLAPLTSRADIERRSMAVEALVSSPALRETLRGSLKLPDLEAIIGRLMQRKAKLADLVKMYHIVVGVLPTVGGLLADHAQVEDGMDAGEAPDTAAPVAGDGSLPGYGLRLTWAAEEASKLAQLVEAVVDDVASPTPWVKASFNEELTELAGIIANLESQIEDEHTRVCRALGSGVDVKCEDDKMRRKVFRVHKRHDKAVQAMAGVVVCGVTAAGSVLFTTTGQQGLRSLGSSLAEHEEQYTAAAAEIANKAMEVARTYLAVLEAAAVALGEVDALIGMAHLATAATGVYCRPTFTHDAPCALGDAASTVDICGARHAVVEAQPGVAYVANDYRMARDSSHFVILTGPNMGGKSTYIRALGVIAILAQMGAFVPAQSASLPIFDAVLTRVGSGDSQSSGVSTFMAEMLESSAILAAATPASLVVCDELGRGTSTYDGFGLAWAIGEHLACAIKCTALFATHFHELTALADACPGAVNAHVSAHVPESGHITMLYAVQPGPCPASFGIHVAKLAGLPEPVLEDARARARELEAASAASRKALADADSAVRKEAAARALAAALARVPAGDNGVPNPAVLRMLLAAHVG